MSTRQNNAHTVATCSQRVNALKEHVKPSKGAPELIIDGKPMALDEVIATYQASLDTRAELIVQAAAYKRALLARDRADAARLAIDQGLRAWVVTHFGKDSTEAEEFGFLPPQVGFKSAETKAISAEKLRATRAARRTMGKRQKQKIRGASPSAPADTPDERAASSTDAEPT